MYHFLHCKSLQLFSSFPSKRFSIFFIFCNCKYFSLSSHLKMNWKQSEFICFSQLFCPKNAWNFFHLGLRYAPTSELSRISLVGEAREKKTFFLLLKLRNLVVFPKNLSDVFSTISRFTYFPFFSILQTSVFSTLLSNLDWPNLTGFWT